MGDESKQEYNRFVTETETGSFLQSYEWGEWQEKLGRQVYRFLWTDDSNQTKAACQVVKMPLPLGQYYLYAPYGPVIGLKFNLPAGEAGIEDLRILTQELQKKFPDAVFLRIEPRNEINVQFADFSIFKSANIQPAVTLLADLSKDPDELLSAMHPKTRYNIKVAQRHQVEVQSELAATPGHGLYVGEVIELIWQTQVRQKYRGHDKAYYRQFVDFFATHNRNNNLQVVIYKALFKRELLACGLVVDFGKTRTYLFGGSSELHKNLMSPYLLHWQAMLDAKKKGLAFYDFGGSEVSRGGERGFTRFKLGFGGSEVRYAGAWDVIFRSKGYSVYKILRNIRRWF